MDNKEILKILREQASALSSKTDVEPLYDKEHPYVLNTSKRTTLKFLKANHFDGEIKNGMFYLWGYWFVAPSLQNKKQRRKTFSIEYKI